MPIYCDTSDNHPQQGMTPEDMRTIERVAARRNEIIMFRDTGCWSRPYIALGHPTKPFHIKGKSSDWGPMAGCIPWNSEYSKAFKAEDIAKGIKANKESLNSKGVAQTIPLRVTEQFYQDNLLRKQGPLNKAPIERVTEPRAGIRYYFCEKPNDDPSLPGKKYVLFGRKTDAGLWEIYTFGKDSGKLAERELFLRESNAERIDVMAHYVSGKSITGDYDLFAICPGWSSFGDLVGGVVWDKKQGRFEHARGARLDQKMDPTLNDKLYDNSHARTVQKSTTGSPEQRERALASLAAIEKAVTHEHEHLGNLTGRVADVIQELQAAMGGGGNARWRVHHNAESGRPFAPGVEDGFPVTTFHPRRGIGPYNWLNATINETGDLRQYFEKLYINGYFPPRNQSWNMRSVFPADRLRAIEDMLKKRQGLR